MSFFGSSPSTGSAFGGSSTSTSSGFFGDAPSSGEPFFGPVEGNSGFLLFDNQQHSGDDGGLPMDQRGYFDEAANVYKELEALGYDDIATTGATEPATLQTLLSDVATLILPEAERGSGFPDGDTVFNFVESGGNLLFFGGTGISGAQLDYINDTFEWEMTGSYSAYGNYDLNESGSLNGNELDVFLTGPDQLSENNGTSYLGIDSLPDDATVIYGREADNETILASIPSGDGQVFFVGWDFFNSFNQDGGWDEVFETLAEFSAGSQTDESALMGIPPEESGSAFFG